MENNTNTEKQIDGEFKNVPKSSDRAGDNFISSSNERERTTRKKAAFRTDV